MSWHHHQLLCGGPETLPADNTGDRCATIDKVLRSLAMPTSVHDTEFILYVTRSATSSQCRSSCKIWVLWVCVNWCHTNPWHLWATACVVFLLLILPNWMFTSPNLQIQGLCHFCRLACHFTVCTLSRCNILLTVVGRCRYNTSLIRLRAEKIDEEDSSTSDERTAEDSEKMF